MITDWQVLEAATNTRDHYGYFLDLYRERRKRGTITPLQETGKSRADGANVVVWIHGNDTKLRCKPAMADEIHAAFERAEKELTEVLHHPATSAIAGPGAARVAPKEVAMGETHFGMEWVRRGDKSILASVLSEDVAAVIHSGGYGVSLYNYDGDHGGVYLELRPVIILSADAALRLADYINARRATIAAAADDENENK